MMKRWHIPLFILCCAAFIGFALFYSGGVNAEIVDILGQLNCPAQLPTDLTDPDALPFGDYAHVESSNLLLGETAEYNGMTAELWKAAGGDCLAILRADERVYVAQYVNDTDPAKYMTRGRFDDKIYAHDAIMDSDVNAFYRIAFFTDGSACTLGFIGANTIAESDLRVLDNSGSVASLFID